VERSEVKKLRLVVFDVDGTLTRVASSWQFLHEKLGTWDKGRRYAERFFQGAITYEDWARLDASLWAGLKLETVQKIVDDMPLTDGAREAITLLRKEGLKVVLISAGLSLVTERIKRETGVDDSLANDLKVRNGFLTGQVEVKVSVDNKDAVLGHMLEKFNLRMDECAAIGDDETLIPLFEKVNLSIAFNPRSWVVEEQADIVVKGDDLRKVLPYLLGRGIMDAGR